MKRIIAIIGFLGALGSSFSLANAGYFDPTPIMRCDVSITRTLQIGSQGQEVYTLQEFLARAGYLQAIPNGNFGPATRAAVRDFQSDNYISRTGTVGPQTRDAINERLCDADVRADNMNDYYGYNTGVTRVDDYDPYAVVMLPKPIAPAVYNTPGNTSAPFSAYMTPTATSYAAPVTTTPGTVVTPITSVPTSNIVPTTSQVDRVNIIYNPYVGYTYGLTPGTGVLTINSPVANSYFREGDTVNVSWTTSNIDASGYQIILENSSGGQSRVVAFSNGNSASFVLTREILETVCSGNCLSYGKNSYKIIVATPLTDIAGNTSLFKASVYPVTIDRPFGLGSVSITTSNTPVNSGEGFRLYVNIPTGASWDVNLLGQYSFVIHALCPAGVSASIAGTPCGQDFSLPTTPSALQQSIPAMITNTSWLNQDVVFELVVKNAYGQVIGTSRVTVTVNGLPFTW